MAKTTGKKKGAPKRIRMSRTERYNQVLANVWQCGGVGGCSRRDIADMAGLAYSPHIIQIIEDMVKEGWLTKTFNPDRPADGYRYFPSDKLVDWHNRQTERVGA